MSANQTGNTRARHRNRPKSVLSRYLAVSNGVINLLALIIAGVAYLPYYAKMPRRITQAKLQNGNAKCAL